MRPRIPLNAIVLVGVLAVLASAPDHTGAQGLDLPDFELKDQFDNRYRQSDYLDSLVIVIAGDREGSEFTGLWGEAIRAELEDEPGFDRVAFLPVAHLEGVPFFIKRIVRSQFPDDPAQWALMDWDGVFEDTYGFADGEANLFVFAPGGRWVHRASGTEVDPAELQALVDVVREILAGGTPMGPSVIERAGGTGR